MADADVQITAGSGTKIDTRTVGAGSDEHRQVMVVGDPTTAANVATVSSAGALSVSLNSLIYPVSTNNSSTAQLAAGATFTGTVESIQNLQAAQISVICDQAYTLNIDQFIDAGATKLVSTDTFTRGAGVPFNENVTLPGNYFRLRVTNNGGSTTTTLSIDVTFGIMATGPRTVTGLGNNRTALNEINGTAVTTGSGASSAGTQRVILASDQTTIPFAAPDRSASISIAA